MKSKIAFDVTGLAWKYRTGVQNLYWAYIDAFSKSPKYLDECEVTFYDRSGIFNQQIDRVISSSYQSCAPRWWPHHMRRPLQVLIKSGFGLNPALGNGVNQVWNWDIYHPKVARGSITIPDILPLEYPQWFSARFRRQTERAISFAADRAEFVNCISHDVKDRLLKFTGMNPKKVQVIYPGIHESYFQLVTPNRQEATLSKFGLAKDAYIISSGFLDPRKNLKRQIEAFALFTKKHQTPLKYVLTGLETNLSQDILELIRSPGLRDRIIFLGYVSADELLVLTSASACVMYCSIAEGFGLPIIEAMALGVPIITSATSAMQELAKHRAMLANPEDPESIAAALEETLQLSLAEQRQRSVSNREFASQFTIDRWFKGHIDHMLHKSEIQI
jgi:glycosyltransferase involved in cell wall biosynthesis